MTVNSSARLSSCSRHQRESAHSPCSRTSGGPLPADRTRGVVRRPRPTRQRRGQAASSTSRGPDRLADDGAGGRVRAALAARHDLEAGPLEHAERAVEGVGRGDPLRRPRYRPDRPPGWSPRDHGRSRRRRRGARPPRPGRATCDRRRSTRSTTPPCRPAGRAPWSTRGARSPREDPGSPSPPPRRPRRRRVPARCPVPSPPSGGPCGSRPPSRWSSPGHGPGTRRTSTTSGRHPGRTAWRGRGCGRG